MNKVVASAIIKDEKGRILAVRLNKEYVGGVWVPPGGKLAENETLRECVVREVEEELGIDIAVDRLAGISEEKYVDGYWTFLHYEAHIRSGSPAICEPQKILAINYIEPEKLKNYDKIIWIG